MVQYIINIYSVKIKDIGFQLFYFLFILW